MSKGSEDKLADLTRQIERLSLVCQSMWELLRDQTKLSDDDLASKIIDVDLRDGKWNGKQGPEVVDCPSCGNPANARRGTCLFCAGPLPRQSMF